MPVSRSELGSLHELGRGGFGVVYRTSAAIGAEPRRDLAYKELHPPQRGKAADVEWNRRAIRESVAFRRKLDDAARAQLDVLAVWPLELVVHQGQVTGYLMRLIEPEFFLKTNDRPVLATVAWLAARNSTVQASGIDAAPFSHLAVRLSLMTQLAYCVAWLHRRGRIFGDLSLSNGVFVAGPTRFLLMDCDATARATDAHRRQAHSPFFDLPEGGRALQTRQSDVYKLALCIVRSLCLDRGSTQLKTTDHLKGRLPLELLSLLDRALGRDPARRPTAKAIWEALSGHLDRDYPQPRFESVETSPGGTVLRGQDVIVRWTCSHADRVTITGPDGATVSCSATKGAEAIRVDRAGEISIRAANEHGHTDATAREVHVYDLPIPELPRVDVPRLGLPQGWRPEISLPRAGIPSLARSVPPLLAKPPAVAPGMGDLSEVLRSVRRLEDIAVRGGGRRDDNLQAALREGARVNREMTRWLVGEAAEQLRNAKIDEGNASAR